MASDEDRYRLSNQYLTIWDPVLYANELCTMKDPDSVYSLVQKRILTQHYSLFKTGEIKGKTFLDVGTGPSPHMLVIPAMHFDNIYASDYVEGCRKILSDWKDKKETALDFNKVFQFISSLDKNGTAADKLESNLRSRIRYVMKCDVLLKNPLEPLVMGPFDCVMTNTCLEGACATVQSFEESMTFLTSLLKSGGHFVATTYINDEYYNLGEHKIECLPVSSEQIKSSLSKAGLNLISWEEEPFVKEDTGDTGVAAGFAVMHAVKP